MSHKGKTILFTVAAMLCALLCAQWLLSGVFLAYDGADSAKIIEAAVLCALFWVALTWNVRALRNLKTKPEVIETCPPHRWRLDESKAMICERCHRRPMV